MDFLNENGHENALMVVDAGRMGKGIISCREIPPGEFVIEYKGHLIRTKLMYDRTKTELTKQGKDCYLMDVVTASGEKYWLVNVI